MNSLGNLTKQITIALVGDSTVADYALDDELRGWGQMLPRFLKVNVSVKNFAKSGRSSKSFIIEGLWDEALKCKADYYFIQFGHNDCPGKEERTTDPNSDYKEYLRQYMGDVRALDAKPILVTPMERRRFTKEGKVELSLDKYAAAMREVGIEHKVALIDLNKRSIELYESLGEENSSYLMCTKDRTHFVEAGAVEMARMVAEEVCLKVPELQPFIFV